MTPSLADQTLSTNFTALPSTPASSAASLSTQVTSGQAGGSSSAYLTSTLPPTTLAGPSYHTAQNQTLTVVSAERDSAVIPLATNPSLPPPPYSTVVIPPTASTTCTLSIMPCHVTSSPPTQSSHDDSHTLTLSSMSCLPMSSLPAQSSQDNTHSTITLPTGRDPLTSINPVVASEVFREHRADLLIAVADPLILATRLYSRKIISRETLDHILLPSFTQSEKNSILLGAVEDRIRTHPSDFLTLFAVLNHDPHLCVFAERLRNSYSTCKLVVYLNFFVTHRCILCMQIMPLHLLTYQQQHGSVRI